MNPALRRLEKPDGAAFWLYGDYLLPWQMVGGRNKVNSLLHCVVVASATPRHFFKLLICDIALYSSSELERND
jgi:hypothetical protein